LLTHGVEASTNKKSAVLDLKGNGAYAGLFNRRFQVDESHQVARKALLFVFSGTAG